MTTEDDPGPEIGQTGARFGGAPRRKARRRLTTAPVPAGDDSTEAIEMVTARPDRIPDADVPAALDEGAGAPVVGLTGARFGSASVRRRRSSARVSEMWGRPKPAGPVPGDLDPAPEPDPGPDDRSASTLVRPYVLTRGRTRSRFELSVETLLSVAPMAVGEPADGEHLAVVELCREPRSVAEIAAMLGVPLGVARVLLGDLAAAGLLAVHRSAGVEVPDLALMERVLTGLRRL